MKKFLVILFVGCSVLVNAQSWVSTYSEVYQKIGNRWEKTACFKEVNTFRVLGNKLVWTGDDVVTYPIKKIDCSDGLTTYVLEGRTGGDLLFFSIVNRNSAVLMFERNGNKYAVDFFLN